VGKEVTSAVETIPMTVFVELGEIELDISTGVKVTFGTD
jgi:hypothetical protein